MDKIMECSKCNVDKESYCFHKKTKSARGYASYCIDCARVYAKSYRKENINILNDNKKIYYNKNKKSLLAYHKEWSINNKEILTEYRREYKNERKATDPIFKLKAIVSNMIYKSIKNNGYGKDSRTHKILGCSFGELMVCLNDNPYKYVYGNNKLDIDHIIPLATAKTKEDVLRLNHYSNLQLLPSYYNRFIKSDLPFDKQHFENWIVNTKTILIDG